MKNNIELTEEIIKSFSCKEYNEHRKEIKEFYKQKRRDEFYTNEIEFMPKELLTETEKNKLEWIKQKQEVPWLSHLQSIKQRCNNKRNDSYKNYGGRGIKCLITVEEIKQLWIRDKAINMQNPSIDRINNNGDYTYDNCCFIELPLNAKKGNKLLLTYDKTYINSVQIFKYRGIILKVWQIEQKSYFTVDYHKKNYKFQVNTELFQFLKENKLILTKFKLIKEEYL